MARKKGQLTAKEAATIEYYCSIDSDSHNNWCKSYVKAGYSDCNNYEANAKKVYDKDMVQAGIEAFKAKTVAKTARTVQSIDSMYQAAYDLAMTGNQPSAAATCTTGIARLYGMDKDASTDQEQVQEMDKAEAEAVSRQAELELLGTATPALVPNTSPQAIAGPPLDEQPEQGPEQGQDSKGLRQA
jgi:hypothetical protein